MSKLPDIDIMLLADDELDEAQATTADAHLASDPVGRTKLAALRELSESVRGHLELAADEDDRLEGLWASVERRLDAEAANAKDPAARPARATSAATAAAAAVAAVRDVARPSGLWARFARWIDEHRGHVLTGALSAGAVAALTLVLRPAGDHIIERVVERPSIAATPAMSTPPEVESLEVPQGSGQVWTISNNGGDDGGSAVVWITPADVEGI